VTEVRQSLRPFRTSSLMTVVVNAPNKDLTLKPGMTATTRIVVDERADVLRAPDQALRYSPGGRRRLARGPDGSRRLGRYASRVLRNGSPSSTVIASPGLDDDTFTEILKAICMRAMRSSSARKSRKRRRRDLSARSLSALRG